MRYLISNREFTRINLTCGTIQNISNICTLEINDSPNVGSGILLPPLNKFSFNDTVLFIRCVDAAEAEIRVVPFVVDSATSSPSGDSSSVDGSQIATDEQIDSLIDNIFG